MADEKKTVGFFEEDAGMKSSSRLLAGLIVFVVLSLYIYVNVMNSIHAGTVEKIVDFQPYSIVALGIAFTALLGKVFIENLNQVSEILGKIAESILKIKGKV